ncbi:MAG: hypothetical protein JWR38_1513 [Mucilaginibacter sp.]|nr:hypothetical protein [Mucilaginibacter sp.]
MANIQAFRAIRPNPLYADQLVFTTPQAESVSGDYTKEGALKPLKTLLETGARQRPETPEGQAMAYQDIKETLQYLLGKERLWHEQTPGIYVYEVVHQMYRQTGIWALTSLENYKDGDIKIHELTFADSVRRLKNYRENTGLEGSPILLTYPPDVTINRIIAEARANAPMTVLGNPHGLHQLWKIEDPAVLQQLTATFDRIRMVYLADGHHRLESAVNLAVAQRAKSLPAYGSLSSLYMATDQLRIQEYDRVVIPDAPIIKTTFFEQLNKYFELHKSPGNQQVQPRELHLLGMYYAGNWYQLIPRPAAYIHKGAADNLDAAILQNQVLGPVFGIDDPKTDPRLKCVGGETAMEEITAICQLHPEAIAFTLCPLTVEQLTAVADAGEILPPKSTWIDPKVPYGLLLHRHL